MTALPMPAANARASRSSSDGRVYFVTKDGVKKKAHILRRRVGEVYVHYLNSDKRLDEWVPESACEEFTEDKEIAPKRKRARSSASKSASPARRASGASRSIAQPDDGPSAADDAPSMTEEEYDLQHHKQITAHRNFDKVNFGKWQIRTWYFSPYPLSESEADEPAASHSDSASQPRIPGVARTTIRSHGRTSDLLAGGLGRSQGLGEKPLLWVCDRCFKYMSDGLSWEYHVKRCTRSHPPGRKVYQRGAHIIWEVDGAKEKLFCQNLSLFGKLFIDVKTLFFDCDNFLFYLLTDATSTAMDHVLGFFSKEKISYDDYNLACIIVLPPYQRKGYGMLMIEFSYELSRRAGKVGTPERPLSDLGLLSYLSYWVSTLVRFLRRLLSVVPPEKTRITSLDLSVLRSPSRDLENGSPKPRKKRLKARDDEGAGSRAVAPLSCMNDPLFTSLRTIQTTANKDGSATSHVMVNCALADLAHATNLRVDDAAFALNECGLLESKGSVDGKEVVCITREMVDKVGKERKVKIMLIDLAHVLL